MKAISLILGLISLSSMSMNTSLDHVAFMNNYEEALAKAQSENKILVVDFTASWCKVCKVMDHEVYSDPDLASYMRQNAVAAKIDIDSFEGLMLKQKYEVNVLPTLMYFYPDGNLADRKSGLSNAKEIMTKIKQYSDLIEMRNAEKIKDPYQRQQAIDSLKNAEAEDAKALYIGQKYKIVLVKTMSYDIAVSYYNQYSDVISEPLFVFENEKSGVYSVTVGNYDKKEQAERMMTSLKLDEKGAFVSAASDL